MACREMWYRLSCSPQDELLGTSRFPDLSAPSSGKHFNVLNYQHVNLVRSCRAATVAVVLCCVSDCWLLVSVRSSWIILTQDPTRPRLKLYTIWLGPGKDLFYWVSDLCIYMSTMHVNREMQEHLHVLLLFLT